VVADASLGRTLLCIAVPVLHSITLPSFTAHIPGLVLLRAVRRTSSPVRGIPLAIDPAGLGSGSQFGTVHLSTYAKGFVDVNSSLSSTRNLWLVHPRAGLLLPLDTLATLHRALDDKIIYLNMYLLY